MGGNRQSFSWMLCWRGFLLDWEGQRLHFG